MENQKNIPTGIKIISVVFYVLFAMGLMSLIFSLISLVSRIITDTGSLDIKGGILPVVLLAYALFCFFIAKGLWKLKNWARISTIVLASVLPIVTLYTIVIEKNLEILIIILVPLLLHVFIAVYLGFFREVKEAFGGKYEKTRKI